MHVRPGVRLRSATCDTEIVVIRGNQEVDLRCGGAPMLPADGTAAERRAVDPAFADGTPLGKRLADEEAGLEVLCVKPGAGSLSIGTRVLALQGARPLPASD